MPDTVPAPNSAGESFEDSEQSQDVQINDNDENASETDRSANTNKMVDSSSEAQPRSRSQSVSQPDSDHKHLDFEPPRPRSISTPVTRKELKEVDSIKGAVPIANALVKEINKEIDNSNARIEKLRSICPPKIEKGNGEHLLQKKETLGMFGKSQSKKTVKFKKVKEQYEEAKHNLEDYNISELSENIRQAISDFKKTPLTISTQEEAMDMGMKDKARALLKKASQNSSATFEKLSNYTQQNMTQLTERTKRQILAKFTEEDLSQALARKQSKNTDKAPCKQAQDDDEHAQGDDELTRGGRSRHSFHNRHQLNHTPTRRRTPTQRRHPRKTPSRKTTRTPSRKTTRTPTRRHPRKTAPRTRRR